MIFHDSFSMIKRRALIVDDSRSARQILGRMLESFGMEVDAVESAELALSYLQTARPDVIFMDHLMSGMDGFAAVRVLKANPDTATIPVLMYTSQEGEVYLSQARALGAVGVLPKTLKHSDVANALQQLHLAGDSVAMPVAAVASSGMAMSRAAAANAAAVSVVSVDDERRAPQPRLNRAAQAEVAADLTAQQLSQRIVNELKAELITQTLQTQPVRRSLFGFRASAGTAAVLLLLGLVVLVYWQYQIQQQLTQVQQTQQQVLSLLQAPPRAASAATSSWDTSTEMTPAATTKAATVVRSETEAVEYGEVPLSGARLERVRTVVDALRTQAFKGTLRVEVFTGDFCLQGNATDGYHVAEDEVPIKRCDLLGNPFADALSVPQRQSVAFANYVASVNNSTSAANSGLRIQLMDGGRQLAASYPAQSATLTAGEWNRSAARNHRVELTAIAAAGSE